MILKYKTGGTIRPLSLYSYRHYFKAGSVSIVVVYSATPHLLRLSPYYRHQAPRKTRIGGQSDHWHNLDQNLPQWSV